jgi:hypothetical protein
MKFRRLCATIGFVWLLLCLGHALAQEIAVTQAVICREVVDRAPVGIGTVFPEGTERVFCFTQIDGAAGETEITHNWYYQGTLKASVVLPVRSLAWRTWSSKSLNPDWTGEWMVEVLGQDGTPLESLTFSIQ